MQYHFYHIKIELLISFSKFAFYINALQLNVHYFARYALFLDAIIYSTTVIAKIKGMPRSLFYDIPRYVTMDSEK